MMPITSKINRLAHQSWGFNFERNSMNETLIAYIRPNSAGIYTSLKPGDKIIRVNGIETRNLNLPALMNIFDNSKSIDIVFYPASTNSSTPIIDLSATTSSPSASRQSSKPVLPRFNLQTIAVPRTFRTPSNGNAPIIIDLISDDDEPIPPPVPISRPVLATSQSTPQAPPIFNVQPTVSITQPPQMPSTPKTPLPLIDTLKRPLNSTGTKSNKKRKLEVKLEFEPKAFGEANYGDEVVEIENPEEAEKEEEVKPIDVDDEIEFLGGNLVVASDMPHQRESCTRFPFVFAYSSSKANHDKNMLFCPKCYCYVCEILASTCPNWAYHCNANRKEPKWKQLRTNTNNPVFKLLDPTTKAKFSTLFGDIINGLSQQNISNHFSATYDSDEDGYDSDDYYDDDDEYDYYRNRYDKPRGVKNNDFSNGVIKCVAFFNKEPLSDEDFKIGTSLLIFLLTQNIQYQRTNDLCAPLISIILDDRCTQQIIDLMKNNTFKIRSDFRKETVQELFDWVKRPTSTFVNSISTYMFQNLSEVLMLKFIKKLVTAGCDQMIIKLCSDSNNNRLPETIFKTLRNIPENDPKKNENQQMLFKLFSESTRIPLANFLTFNQQIEFFIEYLFNAQINESKYFQSIYNMLSRFSDIFLKYTKLFSYKEFGVLTKEFVSSDPLYITLIKIPSSNKLELLNVFNNFWNSIKNEKDNSLITVIDELKSTDFEVQVKIRLLFVLIVLTFKIADSVYLPEAWPSKSKVEFTFLRKFSIAICNLFAYSLEDGWNKYQTIQNINVMEYLTHRIFLARPVDIYSGEYSPTKHGNMFYDLIASYHPLLFKDFVTLPSLYRVITEGKIRIDFTSSHMNERDSKTLSVSISRTEPMKALQYFTSNDISQEFAKERRDFLASFPPYHLFEKKFDPYQFFGITECDFASMKLSEFLQTRNIFISMFFKSFLIQPQTFQSVSSSHKDPLQKFSSRLLEMIETIESSEFFEALALPSSSPEEITKMLNQYATFLAFLFFIRCQYRFVDPVYNNSSESYSGLYHKKYKLLTAILSTVLQFTSLLTKQIEIIQTQVNKHCRFIELNFSPRILEDKIRSLFYCFDDQISLQQMLSNYVITMFFSSDNRDYGVHPLSDWAMDFVLGNYEQVLEKVTWDTFTDFCLLDVKHLIPHIDYDKGENYLMSPEVRYSSIFARIARKLEKEKQLKILSMEFSSKFSTCFNYFLYQDFYILAYFVFKQIHPNLLTYETGYYYDLPKSLFILSIAEYNPTLPPEYSINLKMETYTNRISQTIKTCSADIMRIKRQLNSTIFQVLILAGACFLREGGLVQYFLSYFDKPFHELLVTETDDLASFYNIKKTPLSFLKFYLRYIPDDLFAPMFQTIKKAIFLYLEGNNFEFPECIVQERISYFISEGEKTEKYSWKDLMKMKELLSYINLEKSSSPFEAVVDHFKKPQSTQQSVVTSTNEEKESPDTPEIMRKKICNRIIETLPKVPRNIFIKLFNVVLELCNEEELCKLLIDPSFFNNLIKRAHSKVSEVQIGFDPEIIIEALSKNMDLILSKSTTPENLKTLLCFTYLRLLTLSLYNVVPFKESDQILSISIVPTIFELNTELPMMDFYFISPNFIQNISKIKNFLNLIATHQLASSFSLSSSSPSMEAEVSLYSDVALQTTAISPQFSSLFLSYILEESDEAKVIIQSQLSLFQVYRTNQKYFDLLNLLSLEPSKAIQYIFSRRQFGLLFYYLRVQYLKFQVHKMERVEVDILEVSDMEILENIVTLITNNIQETHFLPATVLLSSMFKESVLAEWHSSQDSLLNQLFYIFRYINMKYVNKDITFGSNSNPRKNLSVVLKNFYDHLRQILQISHVSSSSLDYFINFMQSFLLEDFIRLLNNYHIVLTSEIVNTILAQLPINPVLDLLFVLPGSETLPSRVDYLKFFFEVVNQKKLLENKLPYFTNLASLQDKCEELVTLPCVSCEFPSDSRVQDRKKTEIYRKVLYFGFLDSHIDKIVEGERHSYSGKFLSEIHSYGTTAMKLLEKPLLLGILGLNTKKLANWKHPTSIVNPYQFDVGNSLLIPPSMDKMSSIITFSSFSNEPPSAESSKSQYITPERKDVAGYIPAPRIQINAINDKNYQIPDFTSFVQTKQINIWFLLLSRNINECHSHLQLFKETSSQYDESLSYLVTLFHEMSRNEAKDVKSIISSLALPRPKDPRVSHYLLLLKIHIIKDIFVEYSDSRGVYLQFLRAVTRLDFVSLFPTQFLIDLRDYLFFRPHIYFKTGDLSPLAVGADKWDTNLQHPLFVSFLFTSITFDINDLKFGRFLTDFEKYKNIIMLIFKDHFFQISISLNINEAIQNLDFFSTKLFQFFEIFGQLTKSFTIDAKKRTSLATIIDYFSVFFSSIHKSYPRFKNDDRYIAFIAQYLVKFNTVKAQMVKLIKQKKTVAAIFETLKCEPPR